MPTPLRPAVVFALTLAATMPLQTQAAEDDLFSDVAVESVFGAAEPAKDSKPTARRVVGAASLVALAESAGLKPKQVDSKTINADFRHAGRKLPMTARVAVDRDEIDLTLRLATVENAPTDAKRLLALLSGGSADGAFAYDAENKAWEVRRTLAARGLSGDRLARTLRAMAELALSRVADWSPAAGGSAVNASAESTSPATGEGALTGRYVATLAANEAFAIALEADGRFTLAHVSGGKTTKSTGRAEFTGDRLRLVGDDGKVIAGRVASRAAEGFQFVLDGGRTLAFKRAAN